MLYFPLMKIAVIGLGFMGSTHLKALKNVPEAELAAVVSSDEKKLSGDLSAIQGNIGGPRQKKGFSRRKKYRTNAREPAHPEKQATENLAATRPRSRGHLPARATSHVR